MKKKTVLILTVISMALMLAGCDKKKEYKHDIREVISLESLNDMSVEDIVYGDKLEDIEDMIESLDMQTSEGKKIKKLYKEFYDLMEDLKKATEKSDEKKMEKIAEKLDELEKDMQECVEDFMDEAKDAGVDETDY